MGASKKRATGRPPRPPEKKRTAFTLMLSDEEREALRAVSEDEALPMSVVARRILRAAIMPRPRAKR